MPTLSLRFPAGRYHATPWGHHVNEGLIEWPPSPWRLLRALLATGYNSLHWEGDDPPAAARSMMLKLAGALPQFLLPAASGAHSRHYMPTTVLDKGREKTTLVFDTWANVGSGALLIRWDVALSGDERDLLAQLARHLGYLGRSESWVEAELLQSDVELPPSDACVPCEGSISLKAGWEQIPVLAPELPDTYSAWRAAVVDKALAELPSVETIRKKPTKADKKLIEQRNAAEKPFPPDLLACLQVTTNWLREHGWNQPPGSRKVFYWRRSNALDVSAPTANARVRRSPTIEAMLLALSPENGNNGCLPTIYRTLPQAELLHSKLVGVSFRISGTPSTVLRGRDHARRPLKGAHQHAHVLPLDLDDDQHLDHVLIWAPAGLDTDAQAAIRRARMTFTKGGLAPLRLALAAHGSIHAISGLKDDLGRGLRSILAPHGSREWISATPFFAPRHIKKTGKHTLLGQVQAELQSRNLPEAASIEVLEPHGAEDVMKFRHFVCRRRKGTAPPISFGFAIRLQFRDVVSGPICLGYGSHFGLGLMRSPG